MATEESVLLSYLLNSELEKYQAERSATRELVHQNTIEECKKLDFWKVRTCQDKDMMDIDMNQDETLDEILDVSNDRLTLNQAIEILSIAEKQMTDEINFMEMERNELFQDIQRINEDMSDLRYGRIGPKGLNEVDIIDDLKKLISSCNNFLV
ncbi:10079_t:CDS:2 [Cetraspora pellucida]|uniref:10079_t:CDS:1 n=1 Tax=Cetraspora pellucida TaxID=1433469 RepID=A0A9N9AU02_9GLOM|nr:10079_t:CDS:2 [Cetraspora pellucida]